MKLSNVDEHKLYIELGSSHKPPHTLVMFVDSFIEKLKTIAILGCYVQIFINRTLF